MCECGYVRLCIISESKFLKYLESEDMSLLFVLVNLGSPLYDCNESKGQTLETTLSDPW